MKRGINIWSFPAGTSVEDAMRIAKKAGYDGIELSLDAEGLVSLKSTEAEVRALRALADEIGIEISSLATGLYWDTSLTSDDPEVRERAKDILRFQIKAATWLGVGAILVVPGCVGADFAPGSGVVDYDKAYDRSLEALKELAPEAEAAKVTIAIENVWNKFLLSPIEMRDFIDKIGSDWVKVYFDTGNALLVGYPEQWIKILGRRVGRIHIKDFRNIVGNINGFVDLLAGDVNFPAVMKELRAIGYDGYLTAEMNGFPCATDAVVYRTLDALNRIIAS